MASTIPHGFTVAQLDDKRWYPIRVQRSYSAQYPEGDVFLSTCLDCSARYKAVDVHFKRRDEAVAYCQQQAQEDAAQERREWERLAVGSDLYPERYSHYLDLIREITGHAPFLNRFVYGSTTASNTISIFTYGWYCSCGVWHEGSSVQGALYIEDALAEVANAVYASSQSCQCFQPLESASPIAI